MIRATRLLEGGTASGDLKCSSLVCLPLSLPMGMVLCCELVAFSFGFFAGSVSFFFLCVCSSISSRCRRLLCKFFSRRESCVFGAFFSLLPLSILFRRKKFVSHCCTFVEIFCFARIHLLSAPPFPSYSSPPSSSVAAYTTSGLF